MFDYYGLYCMDEADIECHNNWSYGGNTISRNPKAKAVYEDRMRRMVMRDRNFPLSCSGAWVTKAERATTSRRLTT